MEVRYLLENAFNRYPNRTAVQCEGEYLTYAELEKKLYKVINGLFTHGLTKQDHVAILSPNCLEYTIIDCALAMSGMVRVALNYRLSEKEIIDIVDDSDAKVLVVHESLANSIKDWDSLNKLQLVLIIGEKADIGFKGEINTLDCLLSEASDVKVEVTVNENDIYQLAYTSGTTGRPKGVIHTHGIISEVIMNELADTFPVSQEDVMLVVGALSHAGNVRYLPFLIKGAKVVLLPKFSPQLFFETVDRERVTMTSLVPTTLNLLLEYKDRDLYDYRSLKLITYGGAPMPVPRLREAFETFGEVLYQSYGQTEAHVTICYMSKEEHRENLQSNEARLSSVGKPHTNVKVKIVDNDGNEVPNGEIGEIIVKSRHVMKGYWKREKETSESLRDGWIYTGDLGTLDEAGYVYLMGRKKNMIITGGLNVYPSEIERVIINHPAVFETVVMGIPDNKWGEMIVSAVVLKEGSKLTETELIAYCKEQIAGYKCPKIVRIVIELPKNTYGKVDIKQVANYFDNVGELNG